MLALVFFAAAFVTSAVGVYLSGPAKVDRRYATGFKHNRKPKPKEIYRSESAYAITAGLVGCGVMSVGSVLPDDGRLGARVLGLLILIGSVLAWLHVQRREEQRLREEERQQARFEKRTRMLALLTHLGTHSGAARSGRPTHVTDDVKRAARELLADLRTQPLEPFPYDDPTFQERFPISRWADALHKKQWTYHDPFREASWTKAIANLDPHQRGVLEALLRSLIGERVDRDPTAATTTIPPSHQTDLDRELF